MIIYIYLIRIQIFQLFFKVSKKGKHIYYNTYCITDYNQQQQIK